MFKTVHAAGPPKSSSGRIFWCEVVVAGQDVKRLFEPRACPPSPSSRDPAAPERSDRLDSGVGSQSIAESDERKESFEGWGPSSAVGELNQPLEDRVEVGLFLGGDTIARDFSVSDALQVHGIDQLINSQLVREIRLVA